MAKRVPAKAKTIEIRFEMLEANKFAGLHGSGKYSYGLNLATYSRIYKGNGVRMLLSRGVAKLQWTVTYTTTGRDINTGAQTIDPHVVSMAIKEKCTAGTALIIVSKLWNSELVPELARLDLEPARIDVVLRAKSVK